MDRTLPNIMLDSGCENLKYTPVTGGRGNSNIPKRESRAKHAAFLTSQLSKAETCVKNEVKNVYIDRVRDGCYLLIRGKEGYDLLTKSLEDQRQGVRLLNIKDDDHVTEATIYIPSGKESFLLNKINKYGESEKGSDVIATIEEIKVATVKALWIGNENSIPGEDKQWCEIWLRYGSKENVENVVETFKNICRRLQIDVKNYGIVFPERIVVLAYTDLSDLENLLLSSDYLAELRKMATPPEFFTKMSTYEQREWVQDLSDRIDVSERSNTSVCLLDTGVNNGHPLLKNVLDDSNCYTTEESRGTYDKDGHGTMMAGIATFFDLQEKLESSSAVEIYHYLESVKILDKPDNNDPQLYGAITQQAAYIAEIGEPDANRVFCMAVTSPGSDETEGGTPTSWSAAVDALLAGTVYGISENKRRLMCISAGNTKVDEIKENGEYINAVKSHSVEDPAQAWNAITVGAYTDKIYIDPQNVGFSPVAKRGGVSPFTSSSVSWDSKWPVKPEVVFEGGNLGYNPEDEFISYSEFDNLNMLTTSSGAMTNNLLTTINMTSCATAQAAWMIANIQHYCPDLWPETIRALLIHSADWTDEMLHQFIPVRHPQKKDYRALLRTCGYGVPSLERAVNSARNSVNLIVEGELQPFIKKLSGEVVSNEMNLYDIPWPTNILKELGSAKARMKVTLSYYIEPGPGEIGWKDKYRYPSCGLIFDVNNPTETKDQFIRRISKAMRNEEEDIVSNDSGRWLLGPDNRNVGSIHSDIWEGPAVDLSQSHYIIVYPVTGWWKTRTNLKKYNSKIRYSLIVSIETPENDIDLYTEITTSIKNRIAVETSIEVKNI